MKKIILFMLCLLLLTGCGKKNEDTLVMVTEAGFAPYEYYEGGKIVGVDVAIGKEIAKAMGKKLEVKDVAFDFVINEVKSGKADFGAAGTSITEERKKEIDFTIEYAVSDQVVVVRKDSNINTFDDIKNKTITVQLGTVADQYAEENFKNAKLIKHKKYLSAAQDVKSNKADCIIMDALPAKELVKENEDLRILDGILFQDKYGMIVKKGNQELLNKINEVLQRLIDENKIEEYVIEYSK
ncbi:MAG: ABC transporter substrate-binding protein [Bacilli bacterium]|nr:ABC transporter substrate-binding protein [Bacilli bacterium]